MRNKLLFLVLSVMFFAILAPTAYGADDMSTKNKIKIKKKAQWQRSLPDDSEEYSLDKMEILGKKRQGLILDIKRFLRESTSEDQKSELNLRLGSLYMEDYYATLAKAQQIFEKQNAEYQKLSKDKRKSAKAPKFDNTDALASLDKARSIYRDLIQRFPKHPRIDEMHYFMAMASMDRGKIEDGMAYFKLLSERSPKSRYVNEALVQLGDYYFEKNQFPQSETYFDKLIARKYVPLLPYAYYKKAWCAYNLGRQGQSVQYFKWVIENEEKANAESGAPIRIKSEALKDIALPFADLKMTDEAIQFYRSYGDPHYRRGMETMAALYYEAGEYRNAVLFYETLLAMDANHVKNPTYEISLIESLKMKHEDGAAVGRLFARFPNYLQNSNWYEINAANPTAIKEAASSFEETAWKYATQYHAEGQRTKNNELYNLARKIYTRYLEFFPRTAKAPKARFQLAEILYKQSLYTDAADQYYAVYKDPGAGDLKLEAIKSALMSLDRQLNLDRKKAGLAELNIKLNAKLKDKDDKELALVPYSEIEKKFIAFGGDYLASFPQAKDASEVIYESAYLQYVHHDFTISYKNFWVLIQKYPVQEITYSASYLVLDILNRLKDYPKLVAACKRFLGTSGMSKSSFKTEVADVLRKAELKKIAMLEEQGDFKQAADDYIEYTKAFGQQDEALFEKALYNASVDYTKAGAFLLAVETQEKFLRRFPKSTLRENLLLQVAKSYELLANFEKAGLYFDMFAKQYSGHAQAKNALRLAGLYTWGAGNPSKAEGIFLHYIATYPNDKKAAEKDLLDMYETTGATEKRVRFYMNARAQRGIPISDYVAYSLKVSEILAQKTGKISMKVLEEALRAGTKFQRDMVQTPKGVDAYSKLLFWLAAQKEDIFYKLKLALPQKNLEINLQRKLVLIKDLEKDYARIAGLGSAEWGLGAIFKSAAIYRSMAQEVLEAPVPSELAGEQLETYRKEVEKSLIRPFKEKALILSQQCLDKAQEFNVLSSWTPRCYSIAAELEPGRFPKVRTLYLPPLQLALLAPNSKSSKIQVGNVKSYAYPFFSFGLFNPQGDQRSTASVSQELSVMYGQSKSLGESNAIPGSTSYRALIEERKDILNSALSSEKPSDTKKGVSFSYLNLLRLTNPGRAITMTLEAIQKDPQNNSLHNLLALAYLESGNMAAAKVTLYSLIARGVKNYSIWNNLGVISQMEGREPQAIDYFNESMNFEDAKESVTNLGFLALKYRNGFEAKKLFEKALSIEKDEVTPQIGMAIAQLQNRELETAKEKLIELSRKYKNDPYARLSLGYYLIDVENETELAKRLLSEYMEGHSLENDLQFRQAVQESRKQVGSGEELPSIQ